MKPLLNVICAIIRNSDHKIFIARRAAHKEHAGLWEFPGGKLEAEESHQECIQRELLEELGMKVSVGNFAGDTHHQFSEFSIHLIAYYCQFVSATYILNDHDAHEWIAPYHLLNYPMTQSDMVFAEMLADKD